MVYFLFTLSIGIWIATALWTQTFVLPVLAVLILFGVFIQNRRLKEERLNRTALLPSKIILAASFWGCVAFCLISYQQSIECVNCIRQYLNRDIEPLLGTPTQNILGMWKMYPRWVTMFGLFLSWSILFAWQAHKKGGKTK